MNNVLTKEEKIQLCSKFYEDLCERLATTHDVVGSCNKDMSSYLIPKGTIDELTYYGKPKNSFRISDHWNWYSNVNKCSNENYIQCYSKDAPCAKSRSGEGKPSKPIFSIMVAYYGNDNQYHSIFGERFNRREKKWEFITPAVDDVIKIVVNP